MNNQVIVVGKPNTARSRIVNSFVKLDWIPRVVDSWEDVPSGAFANLVIMILNSTLPDQHPDLPPGTVFCVAPTSARSATVMTKFIVNSRKTSDIRLHTVEVGFINESVFFRDCKVVDEAYAWTVDFQDRMHGLTSGDFGFEETSLDCPEIAKCNTPWENNLYLNISTKRFDDIVLWYQSI